MARAAADRVHIHDQIQRRDRFPRLAAKGTRLELVELRDSRRGGRRRDDGGALADGEGPARCVCSRNDSAWCVSNDAATRMRAIDASPEVATSNAPTDGGARAFAAIVITSNMSARIMKNTSTSSEKILCVLRQR